MKDPVLCPKASVGEEGGVIIKKEEVVSIIFTAQRDCKYRFMISTVSLSGRLGMEEFVMGF